MRFQLLLIQSFYALLVVIPGLAHAAPTDLVEKATVPCDDISKYTVAWFVSNTCKRPPAATCLFYTRGLSGAARKFSKKDGNAMTTIWEMWTSDLYVLKQVKSNPLRCIAQDKGKRRQYFGNMSAAMATMCDVFATVMDVSVDKTKDKEKVNKNGIWYYVEYPTLRKADNEGKVNQIEATNPDGSIVFTYWVRGSEKLRRRGEPGNEPRSTCGIDDEDIPASVDEGGEFEVDW